MRIGGGCVQPSFGRYPRACLAGQRGYALLLRLPDRFVAGFQLAEFFWCKIFGARSDTERLFALVCLREPQVASHDSFCGGLKPGRPVQVIGGEGVIPNPSFPHLSPTSLLTQESSINEVRGVSGGIRLPLDCDEERRVVGEFFSPMPLPQSSLPFPPRFGKP